MPRRQSVETAPSHNRHSSSIKPSRSNGHHRHHRHRHEQRDPCVVGRKRRRGLDGNNSSPVEEPHVLRTRLSMALAENQKLAEDFCCLKASLSVTRAEADHLYHLVVPRLRRRIMIVCSDNNALRRWVEDAGGDLARQYVAEERLRQSIQELKRERNELRRESRDLGRRVKAKYLSREAQQDPGYRLSDLSREVNSWKDRCTFWKSEFEEMRELHAVTCVIMETKMDKITAYEAILTRHGLI